MQTRTGILQNATFVIMLGGLLAMPLAAEASRGHHRHGHSHFHYHDGYGHTHYHSHGKKRKYKRKHYGGYSRAYAPPRYYYNQPYYPPQPAYGYGGNYYRPQPMYGYPPQRMMGISTGHGSFMIRY